MVSRAAILVQLARHSYIFQDIPIYVIVAPRLKKTIALSSRDFLVSLLSTFVHTRHTRFLNIIMSPSSAALRIAKTSTEAS